MYSNCKIKKSQGFKIELNNRRKVVEGIKSSPILHPPEEKDFQGLKDSLIIQKTFVKELKCSPK